MHAVGIIVEAATNFPIARIMNKSNNLEEAITGNHEWWQRAAMLLGWNRWNVGAEDVELEEAKDKAKEIRIEKNKIEREEKKKIEKQEEEQRLKDEGYKTVRCSGTNSKGKKCSLTTSTKEKSWLCFHHANFSDGQDADGDGVKEYQCTGITKSGKRCRNKGEYTGKKKRCYAHQ